jgi:serine/threonine protein kinase
MASDVTRDATATPSALPAGTRLGEFELRRVIGVGGFGIVYLAFDHALEREVAVKEYMPAALVGRTETMHVTLRSQNDADTFALGLKSFVNEARMLARFDHPSLLKVHRFWEANGTAYMAMPVLHGKTLKELRLASGTAPDEAWLRYLLEPLLGAIEKLHNEGVFHRDIAPDNIQIEPDGRPVLMDFGAARRVIGDKSQNLTAILKPAYAPIEQYAEVPSVKQGPWTDLYALGATVHYMLIGKPPTPSTARAIHDDQVPLAHRQLPGCSVEFLRCIDWMLGPRPADRPQNVAQLRDALAGRTAPPYVPPPAPAPDLADWQTTVAAKPGATATPDLMLDDDLLRSPPQPFAPPPLMQPPSPPKGERRDGKAQPATPRALASAPPPAKSRLPLLAGAAVAVVVAVGAAVALWPKAPPPAAEALQAQPAPAPMPAPAVAVPVAPPPAATVAASTPAVTEPPTAAAPSPATATAPPAAAPAANETPAPTVPPATAAIKPDSKPAAAPPPKREPPPRPSVAQQAAPGTPQATPAPAAARRDEPVARSTPEPQRPPPPVAVPPAATPPATQAQATPTNPATPAQASDDKAATGPEAICSARNPVMYFVCMERECLRSRWMNHSDCQKWRASRPQN